MQRFRLLCRLLLILPVILICQDSFGQQSGVRYAFQPPPGWAIAQKDSASSLLISEEVDGYVLVLPHGLPDLKSVRAEMQVGLIQEGMCRLLLKGKLENFGKNMLAGNFEGEFQGKEAKARVIGMRASIGIGGVYVMGVDLRERFSGKLAKGTEEVARAIRFESNEPTGK